VERGWCSGSAELGGNHCGALQKKIELAPGEEARLIFMLGVGAEAAGEKIRSKYKEPANVDAEFSALRKYWEQKFDGFQCQTPHEVPVIVTVTGPPTTEDPVAVRVNTLDPVAGFVPNDAVTPLGKPVAERVTLPENPFAPEIVIVSLLLLP